VLDGAMSVANLAVAVLLTVAVRFGSGARNFSRLSGWHPEIESLMNGKARANGYESEISKDFYRYFSLDEMEGLL
jgi:hypothetical protein